MAVEDLNASNDNCILGFLIAGEKHSSNFDTSPKQSFELVRRIEQAARQADAVIELTKELRQQLRQDIRRRSARPNGVSHRRWNSGSLFLAMPVSDR